MKQFSFNLKLLISFINILLLCNYLYAQDQPYLGQASPGREFVRFAPNTIPEDMFHSVTISPDGYEIYWAERSGIKVTKLRDGQWTTPEFISFSGNSGQEFYDDAPVISPDNNKLFFNSRRPCSSSTVWNFWYSERTASGWSEPVLLGQEFDSYTFHWQVSIANNGNLYFTGYKTDLITNFERDIYLAHFVNGEYINFVNLGDSVNTADEMECTPWISPDEDYLIFSRGGGNEFSDLLINFKKSDGTWTKAKNMTGVNSPYHDINPIMTPDGKYLIFTSEADGGPYWVDATVIGQYR